MDVSFDKETELNNEPAEEQKDPVILATVEEMMKAGRFSGRKSS